jgi:hypothetical protein
VRIWCLVLIVAGCPSGPGGTSPSFSVTYRDQPAAGYTGKVGVRFFAPAVGTCTHPDGTEARWTITGTKVSEGALPPGLHVEDGAIVGTPTTSGTFEATVQFTGATCAGKVWTDPRATVKLTIRGS